MPPAGPSRAQRAGVVLAWLSLAAILVSALAALGLSFRYDVFGLRVSLHNPMRPLWLAVLLGFVAALLAGLERAAAPFQYPHRALSRHAVYIAAALAIGIGILTVNGRTRVAGGADQSGYVSQSKLWLAGKLAIETPLAHELTVEFGQWVFTPSGYRPSGDLGTAVPLYPPGAPLLMAAAQTMAGDGAEYLVGPACLAGMTLIAFFLGRRLGGPDAGLLAAAATAASPIALYEAVQPMSDVPAAFCWTLAVWLLTHGTLPLSLLAAVAATVACFVRPNLFAVAPLLIAAAAWSWRTPGRRIGRVFVFALPIVAAAASWALYQRFMYGNVTETGYGGISNLFSLSHVLANLQRYPVWILSTHSPLILLALAGPLAIRRGWVEPAVDRGDAERFAWSGIVFFAALQGFYLLYLVFEDWVFVRFLLPALPWLLVSFGAAIAGLLRNLPSPIRGTAVLLATALVATWGVAEARSRGAFRLILSEHRYMRVVDFARTLPPNAAYVTLQHSGSLYYYLSVPVVRWDWLGPDELDRAVAGLAARGRPVYAVLENWEETRFRERFAGAQTIAKLVDPIFQTGLPTEIKVHVYRLAGTTTAAAAGPVSWPRPPAPRIPSTPAAPGLALSLASSGR
jgi:hypothetical protein